jgi:hypothetical protein
VSGSARRDRPSSCSPAFALGRSSSEQGRDARRRIPRGGLIMNALSRAVAVGLVSSCPSVVRVPFRILTEEENEFLDKNYGDIEKQVEQAFKKKS